MGCPGFARQVARLTVLGPTNARLISAYRNALEKPELKRVARWCSYPARGGFKQSNLEGERKQGREEEVAVKRPISTVSTRLALSTFLRLSLHSLSSSASQSPR